MESSSSIQVVVRLRPMNEKEKKHSTLPVIKASTIEKTVTVIKGQGTRQARNSFAFDNVFSSFSSQQEVFDGTLKPVIRDVLSGYESTIFAYGQTGTGKTHTMEGDLSSPEQYGIIPRSAEAIFDAVSKPDFQQTRVTCSYLEIYNEDLGDLLLVEDSDDHSTSSSGKRPSPSKRNTKKKIVKLEILEGSEGPFCRGLTEVEVQSAADVLSLMQRAQQYRKVGETKMNRQSSRSHCLFTIKVESGKKMRDGSIIDFRGKLHMVDLAGSECAKSAGMDKGSSGSEQVARERERMNINRSLLTLGRVIKMLKEQSEKGGKKSNIRIPYRDSKLTRILQESLGGRCKTLIVATVSPSMTAIEESLSTLHYAQSANGIINKPISSSKMSLAGRPPTRSGESNSTEATSVDTWYEMECRLEYMQSQVEEAQAALARKHMQQQELEDKADKAVAELETCQGELEAEKEANTKLEKLVEEEKKQKEALAELQRKTEIALKQTSAILEVTKKTEISLTEEAKDLLANLEQSIDDSRHLHNNLTEAREDEVTKRQLTQSFHAATLALLKSLVNKMDEISSLETKHKEEMMNLASAGHNREMDNISKYTQVLESLKADIEKRANVLEHYLTGEHGLQEVLANSALLVKEKSDIVRSSVENGETALFAAFDDVLSKLSQYSHEIEDMNTRYIESSKECASSMEKKISKAKNKLVNIFTVAKTGLSTVSEANESSKTQLNAVLESIIDMTKSSVSNISKPSRKQCNILEDSLKSFDAGMKFDNMKSTMASQSELLQVQGSQHVKDIDALQNIINMQKKNIQDAAEKQKKLRDQALKEIMNGVQNLVRREISNLGRESDSAQKIFLSDNAALLNQNDTSKASITSLLSDVKKSVEHMGSHVDMAQKNDEMIKSVVQDTIPVFQTIAESAKKHSSNIKSAVSKGVSNVSDLGDQIDLLVKTSSQLDADGKELGMFVSDTVMAEVKAGVQSMNEGTKRLSQFASETILKQVEGDVNAMRQPRRKWKSEALNNIDQISSTVEDSSIAMSNVIKTQIEEIQNLSKATRTKADTFINRERKEQEVGVNDHTAKIKKQLQALSSSTTESLSSSRRDIEALHGKVDHHTNTDIKCYDVVEPIAKRRKITYNPSLSSTPADSEILASMDLYYEAKEEKSDHSADSAVVEETPEEDEQSLSDGSVRSRNDVPKNILPTRPSSSSQNEKENISRNPNRMEREGSVPRQKSVNRLPKHRSRSKSASRKNMR